jgi:hypothetical protein
VPKVVIKYRRTKTIVEEGIVEIEVDSEVEKTLREGKNMEAWATFTMVQQVPAWTPAPIQKPTQIDFTATIDGQPVNG